MLKPKKIANLIRNKKETVLIENKDWYYHILYNDTFAVIYDKEQFKKFKTKFNSYKTEPDIPTIKKDSYIYKYGVKEWEKKEIKKDHLPSSIIKKYKMKIDSNFLGYKLKDYLDLDIKIGVNNPNKNETQKIYFADKIGFIGIKQEFAQFLTPKMHKLYFLNSRIYIYYRNEQLIGYIQSGRNNILNKEIEKLNKTINTQLKGIDNELLKDDKIINGVENTV